MRRSSSKQRLLRAICWLRGHRDGHKKPRSEYVVANGKHFVVTDIHYCKRCHQRLGETWSPIMERPAVAQPRIAHTRVIGRVDPARVYHVDHGLHLQRRDHTTGVEFYTRL